MYLTPTEKNVIEMLCKKGIGLRNYKELADALYIQHSTLKTHLINIFLKFHIQSKAELVYKYYMGEILKKGK